MAGLDICDPYLGCTFFLFILCFPTKQIYPNAIHTVKNVLHQPHEPQQFWAYVFYSYLIIFILKSAQHFTFLFLYLLPLLVCPRLIFELTFGFLCTYLQMELVDTFKHYIFLCALCVLLQEEDHAIPWGSAVPSQGPSGLSSKLYIGVPFCGLVPKSIPSTDWMFNSF